MSTSNIEWTGHVWNPIVGCTVHSPGCTNCYAMRMAHRLEAMAEAGNAKLDHYSGTTKMVNGKAVWTGKIGFSEEALLKPLRRRKPTPYFVNSMSDLFHESVPDEMIDRVFAVMALCPQHTFQLLTKRSARMREYMTRLTRAAAIVPGAITTIPQVGKELMIATADWPLPNVWLGVSVEDQARADERISDLLATPAAIRWISAEPLLGPVDLTNIGPVDESDSFEAFDSIGSGWHDASPKLDWIVCGGESGPGARGSDAEVEGWMRYLLDQCQAAGTAFYGKQGYKKHPLPADLMVREYPDAL